jgi:hypothetical protein
MSNASGAVAFRSRTGGACYPPTRCPCIQSRPLASPLLRAEYPGAYLESTVSDKAAPLSKIVTHNWLCPALRIRFRRPVRDLEMPTQLDRPVLSMREMCTFRDGSHRRRN